MRNHIPALLTAALTTSCATLESHVQNDPINPQPSGDRVAIRVMNGQDKEPVEATDSMMGKYVTSEAAKWLKAKGYKLVREPRKADTVIVFSAVAQTRNVHVPGQSYSLPVYGNQGTRSVVKNAYGERLGSIETEPANALMPTGYQTGYMEAYDTTVTGRSLEIDATRFVRGKNPEQLVQGEIHPTSFDQPFFESESVMSQAVTRLLSESAMNSPQRMLASMSEEEPGCWLRLGINFDMGNKLSRGAKVKSFLENSNAERAGLRVGDVIFSIAGKEVPDPRPAPMKEGVPVSVVGMRGDRELLLKVVPTMMCVE